MAPNPQCTAVAAAKARKGLSYGQIAQLTGMTETHVIEVCTGDVHPSQSEFNSLAKALDITAEPPHDGVHATT